MDVDRFILRAVFVESIVGKIHLPVKRGNGGDTTFGANDVVIKIWFGAPTAAHDVDGILFTYVMVALS